MDEGGTSWRAWGVALAVFAVALAATYPGFWGSDLRREVPYPTRYLPEGVPAEGSVPPLLRADYRLAVWGVGRNAWTLTHRPARLYDAEPCYPVDDALALHHPLITPAIEALPVQLALAEPVASFNAALFAKPLIEGLAMFLLVTDWAASPAAGVVAGLLYAFHPSQVGAPYHFFTSDGAWLLLGLFFARRLFERGRWSDAAGLAVCCALQMGASFYPFFAAMLAAPPLAGWLLWHYRRVPVSRVLAVVAAVALAAVAVFGPYLERSGEDTARGLVTYAGWGWWFPGGHYFPGWTALALAAWGLVRGRARVLPRLGGDPRPALIVAALLIVYFAAGGNEVAREVERSLGRPAPFSLPNPFRLLGGVVPGLDTVRIPAAIGAGARQLLCLLAGLGAAALLRSLPRRARLPAAVLLAGLAFVEGARPGHLLPGARPAFEPIALRPPDATLAFFASLPGDGPLLELPADYDHPGFVFQQASAQHLLSAYHHRRTSGCYSSFIPDEVRRLQALSADLEDPRTLDALTALGFTTVVAHHGGGALRGRAQVERVRRAAEASGGRLVPLARTPALSAWALRAVQ